MLALKSTTTLQAFFATLVALAIGFIWFSLSGDSVPEAFSDQDGVTPGYHDGTDIGKATSHLPSSFKNDLQSEIKLKLIDPSSAQFRGWVKHGRCVGGEYNAKNRAGGYNGFEPFVAFYTNVIAHGVGEF
jgi:hypothetical protein